MDDDELQAQFEEFVARARRAQASVDQLLPRKTMRYICYFCHKSVTSELPDDAVIRAILVCPECIETKKVIIVEPIAES